MTAALRLPLPATGCPAGIGWHERLVLPGVELYLGDSLEIAPTLQGVDAVISDPPYGMDWNPDTSRFTGGSWPRGGGNDEERRIMHDDEPFDPAPWLGYPKCVLWGFQHYASRLPVGTSLVWIKRNDQSFGSFLSDAELAWMKGGYGAYCFRKIFNGSTRAADAGIGAYEKAVHPSQKPVALMAWCMDKAKVPEGATVLDPYMGSGSTIIAAIRTGRKAIGIEKCPKHFQTACERIKRELAQGDLFLGQNA
jgi:site-specific DNA-methyltransferase (adenine-specific)